MRILITGGAGFIGSALCHYLMRAEADHEVCVVDRLTYAACRNSLDPLEKDRRFVLHEETICNRSALSQLFQDYRPDWVFHLAAETHVDRSIDGAAPFIETNILGTYTLLDAARAYWSGLSNEKRSNFRIIHVSTDEVYGSLGPQGAFHEETAYDPSSPYSASKAASDHLAMAWQRTYGLPIIISNCSNNYGPRQFPEKLIPLMILRALEGLPLPVYGDGQNIRDWLYVEDHVRGLVMLAEGGTPGRKYNMGGGAERTNLEVVRSICDHLATRRPRPGGYQSLIEFVADRPGHDQRYAIDARRIETELGWQPKESFESGLVRTIDWYLEHRAWWEPLLAASGATRRQGLAPAQRDAPTP